MVPQTEATGVFLARRKAIFWSRFRLDRGKFRRSESCTPCMNVSSFLKFWTCKSNRSESERIRVQGQHPRGENCGIFNIVLFLPSVFARTVDVALDVGFRRSWCRRKACATFFLKVLDLHRGELGFARYDPANRGCRSVFHVGGSFSDRDSGLTGEALDYPRVARFRWSYPLPQRFQLTDQIVVGWKESTLKRRSSNGLFCQQQLAKFG